MSKVVKTDAEWREQLTPEQYRVARQKGTERPFTGEYEQVWATGRYFCIGCGQELFESDTKFDAGCGWPSFYEPSTNAPRPPPYGLPAHLLKTHLWKPWITFVELQRSAA